MEGSILDWNGNKRREMKQKREKQRKSDGKVKRMERKR